jgi:rhamnosyltransferase
MKVGLLCHDRWVTFLGSSFGKTVVLAEPLASYRQHGANLFGFKSPPVVASIKIRLHLDLSDLLDHRTIASHRAKILLAAKETLGDATLAQQAELASRRWQAITNIYELRVTLHGSTPFAKRLSAFINLLRANAYLSYKWGGLGLGRRALLKDSIFGLICGRSFHSGFMTASKTRLPGAL